MNDSGFLLGLWVLFFKINIETACLGTRTMRLVWEMSVLVTKEYLSECECEILQRGMSCIFRVMSQPYVHDCRIQYGEMYLHLERNL